MALGIIMSGTVRSGLFSRVPVDIISLDFDWWQSLDQATGTPDPDYLPMALGPDGFIYYGRIRLAGQSTEPTWPDTFGHPTVAETQHALSTKLGRIVRWQSKAAA
jgi:hypothetical protein